MNITVITPTVPGREHLLGECLASVAAQTFRVAHLIGTDTRRDGPAVIRNQLAEQAATEWLLPLDDDDLVDPGCAAALLAQSGGADVVIPWCRVVDDGEIEPWCPNRLFRPETILIHNFVPVTVLIRRETWLRIGGQPERVNVEDYRFMRRLVAAGARFKVVPEILWSYRRGVSGGSRNDWTDRTAA